MSDACTIYCNKADYGAVCKRIAGISQVPLQIVGTEEDWRSITVAQRSVVTFSSMRQHPGEFTDFSKLILGTYSFFRNIQTSNHVRQESILRNISECHFAVGIVCSPEYSEAEGHYDMIFAVAEACDGIIFNGSGMLDKNGLMILDSGGNFDVG